MQDNRASAGRNPAPADLMSFADIYHHVIAQVSSPKAAEIAISTARKNGQLRLYAEQREHKAQPGVQLKPGQRPPQPEPEIVSECPVPSEGFNHWDWERGYATRPDRETKSLFEYVGIVGLREDVDALWPVPKSELSTSVKSLRLRGRGNRPQYDWDAIQAECFRRFDYDGFPDRNGITEFAEQLREWCEAKFGSDGTPEVRTLRDYLGRWLSAWRRSI